MHVIKNVAFLNNEYYQEAHFIGKFQLLLFLTLDKLFTLVENYNIIQTQVIRT